MESDSSSQETVAIGNKWGSFSRLAAGNTWQSESDYPELTGDTDAVLRMLFVPEDSSRLEEGLPGTNSSLRRSTVTSISVKEKMKKSLNHIRHSLHSTTRSISETKIILKSAISNSFRTFDFPLHYKKNRVV